MASSEHSSEELLDKVRSEIALTREWKQIHQEVRDELKKSMKSDDTVNNNERRVAIVKKASETAKEMAEYKQLEEKVAGMMHQHFFRNPKTKKAKLKTQLADEASARIIQQWPLYRTHLKEFINIPLPVHLRKAAWSIYLKDKKVKKEFLAFYDGMKPDVLLKKNQRLAEKCSRFLQGRSLSELKKVHATPYILCAVVSFWGKRTGMEATEITESDILLCFHFIHCCRLELGTVDGDKQLNWTVASEVAEMYCAFMAMMPLNMKNVLHDPKNAEAVIILCKEVESLLNVSEPKLTVQLNKILQITSLKEKKSERISFVFHKQLLHLVHPFIQRMFVGTCSLETLCFLLDQCLIFLELPKFTFMPYCIATWIILLKKKLMNCHNVESVSDVLARHSVDLTVEDFQQEIGARFLSDIKQEIKIEIDDGDDDEHYEGHSLISRVDAIDCVEPTAVKVERKHLLISKNSDINEEEHPQKESRNEDELELELLKTQVKKLSIKQEKQIKEAEEIIERERESYQNKIKELQQEMTLIKETLMKDREKIKKKPVAPISGLLPLITKGASPRIPSSLPKLPGIKSGVKKFDPNSLTSSDVQEINETILKKFTEAMYLICHGSSEEKEGLKKNLDIPCI